MRLKSYCANIAVVIAAIFLLAACGDNEGVAGSVLLPQAGASYNVGDVIQFGGSDWIVLDVQDDAALIFLEDFFARESYEVGFVNSFVWSSSSLHTTLNHVLFTSFGDEDRARVLEVTTLTDMYPYFETDAVNESIDHVFLLSIEEVERYFPDEESRIINWLNGEPHSWWLRSPGENSGRGAYVDSNGEIVTRTTINASRLLRPAMWIRLD